MIHSGGGEVVPDFVSNSLGIFLWRIRYFLARRSSYIVVNSHSMLTSPRENCMDCSRKIHRIDPFVDSVIRFLASLEYSRSARITYINTLNSGHVSGKTAYNRLPYLFRINMKSSDYKGMQILSLRRCNLISSTLTKEAVLRKSCSSLISATSSSLRSSMVKGDRPSMVFTRDG